MLFDSTALSRDPNLYNFPFEPGSLKPVLESEDGMKVYNLLTSRFAIAAIYGAVQASRVPPMPAIEELLYSQMGDAAFTDPLKQLTGRFIRQAIEHLGGEHVSRNAPMATAESRFSRGSTYKLPKNNGYKNYFDTHGVRGAEAGVQLQPPRPRTVVVEVKKRRVVEQPITKVIEIRSERRGLSQK